MAITRSQIARQLLAGGGLSLEDAKMMAPKNEFLAYINPKEADMLRSAGGSGIMTAAGIPSFTEDEEDTGDVSNPGGGMSGGSNDGGGGDDQEDDNARMAASMGITGPGFTNTGGDGNDVGGLRNIINYVSNNKRGILQNIIGTALLGPAYPMIGLGLAGIGAYRNMRNNNVIDDTDGGIGDKFKDTLDRFKQLGDPNKYFADVSKMDLNINKMRGSKAYDLPSFRDLSGNQTLTQEELDGIRDGTITAPTGKFAV